MGQFFLDNPVCALLMIVTVCVTIDSIAAVVLTVVARRGR